MKTQLFLLFLAVPGLCQRIPVDKQKHFAAGGIISEFSYVHPSKHPFWNAVLASAVAGVAKETYDYHTGFKFDTKDVAFTVGGGAFVGGIMYFVTKKSRTKRKKL